MDEHASPPIRCCAILKTHGRGLQAPPAADLLRELCRQVQKKLQQRKFLLIIDDVWSEDFPLFESGWLGIDTLHGRSACVITSRHAGLAATGGKYDAIEHGPVDGPSAQRILLQMARVTTTEACAPPDVPSEIQVRDSLASVVMPWQ